MKLTALIATIFALASAGAVADEERHFFPTQAEKDMTFFDKGSWVSNVHVAHYNPEDPENRNIEMLLVNVGATKYFWKNVGFVADAHFFSTSGDILVNDDTEWFEADSVGIGGSLGLKWHVLRGENWSAYVKGTFGMILTDDDFPPGGTGYNFMRRGDVGITIRLRKQLHLDVAGSWLHISNGKGLNPSNPAYDGEGGYVGIVYRFDTFDWFTREAGE